MKTRYVMAVILAGAACSVAGPRPLLAAFGLPAPAATAPAGRPDDRTPGPMR